MLRLPEELREELAKPQGRLYKNGEKVYERIEELNDAKLIACVGDLVTAGAIGSGVDVSIAVIDGKTLREERVEVDIEGFSVLKTENPPGFVSCELVATLKEAVLRAVEGGKICVLVDGEEDLAALPLALMLPEGSVILYGQPGEGVVAVRITGKKKVLIRDLLRRMEKVSECPEIEEIRR